MLETVELPELTSWASLLGLLTPREYFVTVDHSVLWQRHVAWAKPKGEDLRQYVTQRFASNMVVLSLMLGAQINVFFNSSVETSEMRKLLQSEAYGNLRYWIGLLIALDAFVTIIALVATFTLWGIISAISDTNTHALLRSSIGQYVISLPPRFVVTSLYLFIFWLLLFFIDLVTGPCRIILTLVILFLFFEVVVPLSAFGRLVLHTGAMAKRRVLEEDFEKELLPSGLHASLLIRATGQRRKYTNAINQYRKKSSSTSKTSQTSGSTSQPRRQRSDFSERSLSSYNDAGTNSERQIVGSTRSLSSDLNQQSSFRSKKGHKRTVSGDTFFPRASVLNTCTDLKSVVEQAMSEIESEDGLSHESKTQRSDDPTDCNTPATVTSALESPNDLPQAVFFAEKGNSGRMSIMTADMTTDGRPPLRSSSSRTIGQESPSVSWRKMVNPPRRSSVESIISEWETEKEVRNLYHATPPAPPIYRDETMEAEPRTHHPRPSMLNRITGLQSLQSLFHRESMQFGSPESSVGDEDEIRESQRFEEPIWGEGRGRLSPTEHKDAEGSDIEAASCERESLLHGGSENVVYYSDRGLQCTR